MYLRLGPTSVDLMTAIVRLAGWTPRRRYPGDEPSVRLANTGEWHALGQSTVLRASEATPLG